MSKVIVRGGLPGQMRVELEGTDTGVDLPTDGNAYQTAHMLAPFMQVLADSVPTVAHVEEPPPAARPSRAPKGGA